MTAHSKKDYGTVMMVRKSIESCEYVLTVEAHNECILLATEWQFVEGEMFRKAIVSCLLIPYSNYTIYKAVQSTSIIMFRDAIEYIYAFFEVVDLEILILQISYLVITQTHKLNIFDLNALLGL